MSQQVTQSTSNPVLAKTKVDKIFSSNQPTELSSKDLDVGGSVFRIDTKGGSPGLTESRFVQSSFVESGNVPIVTVTRRTNEIVGPSKNKNIPEDEKKETIKRKGGPMTASAEKRVGSAENRLNRFVTEEIVQGTSYPLTYYNEHPSLSLQQSYLRAPISFPPTQSLTTSQYVIPGSHNVHIFKF